MRNLLSGAREETSVGAQFIATGVINEEEMVNP